MLFVLLLLAVLSLWNDEPACETQAEDSIFVTKFSCSLSSASLPL